MRGPIIFIACVLVLIAGIVVWMVGQLAPMRAAAPGSAAGSESGREAVVDEPPLIAEGRRLHVKLGCAVCHKSDGSKGVGPSYAGQWGSTVALANGGSATYDPGYVRMSLLDPKNHRNAAYPGLMPSYLGKLSVHDVWLLTVYIMSQTDSAREQAYEWAREM